MINSSYHCIYLCMSNSLIYLNGVNSISINKSISHENGLFLGAQEYPGFINQPNNISVSIDKSFVEHDPIQTLTGTNKVDYLYYSNGGRFFQLRDLYLNSMQASFEVGDLPKINFTLSSYNGRLLELNGFDTSPAITLTKKIPRLNSIYISSQNQVVSTSIKSNNYIYSMDYSVNINRQAYYSIGSYNEAQVTQILPLEISASITAKEKNNSFLSTLQLNDNQLFYYDFNINVSGDISTTSSFPVRRAKFVSREIKTSSDYFPDMKYTFKGFLGGKI